MAICPAALAPVLAKVYGTDRVAYHLTADYTWGWTQEESIAAATENLGWSTVNQGAYFLGSCRFLVLNYCTDAEHYGGNMVNSLTNAVQFWSARQV